MLLYVTESLVLLYFYGRRVGPSAESKSSDRAFDSEAQHRWLFLALGDTQVVSKHRAWDLSAAVLRGCRLYRR
jgi:hypothetical protein